MMWEWLATTLPSCEQGETLSVAQKEENQFLNGIISALELGLLVIFQLQQLSYMVPISHSELGSL